MASLDDGFDRLRPLLVDLDARLELERDDPGDVVVRVPWVRDDGYQGWFGAVKTSKRYVSYHLMPACAHPELLDDTSSALRKRMQGTSCFTYTRVDEALFEELEQLTRRGLERFDADGLLGRGALR